ncbi:hypothetical protein [Haliea sp. E17]|uniref:bestrophin-like domain n=1 Tax=Haliea sp. E17 TaxID=3401576 RepID=UPI003AAD20A0
MYQIHYLDSLALPIVLVLTIAFIALSAEIGFRVGRKRLERLPEGETSHMGAAVASTLGLLAFMLAFTFGSGTTRLDERRALVLESSNAVNTAYLRTALLSEPYRGESRVLLADYVGLLVEGATVDRNAGDAQAYATLLSKREALTQLQQQLWSVAVTAAREDPRPTNSLYLAALNTIFDLLQKRFTVSVQQRMPGVFWLMLFCLAGLAIGLAGYDSGVSRSQRNSSIWAMTLAFAFVIVLVVAIDRPRAFPVSQMPLQELQARIGSAVNAGD